MPPHPRGIKIRFAGSHKTSRNFTKRPMSCGGPPVGKSDQSTRYGRWDELAGRARRDPFLCRELADFVLLVVDAELSRADRRVKSQ